jgi:hypothetical protein
MLTNGFYCCTQIVRHVSGQSREILVDCLAWSNKPHVVFVSINENWIGKQRPLSVETYANSSIGSYTLLPQHRGVCHQHDGVIQSMQANYRLFINPVTQMMHACLCFWKGTIAGCWLSLWKLDSMHDGCTIFSYVLFYHLIWLLICPVCTFLWPALRPVSKGSFIVLFPRVPYQIKYNETWMKQSLSMHTFINI